MTIDFLSAKESNPITTECNGKEYCFVKDAEFYGNDLKAVVIGEDNKLYYATFEFDEEKELDEQNYETAEEVEVIGWNDELYNKYECEYDD